MKNKIIVLFIVTISLVSTRNYGQEKKGLVGLLYDDLKLTRITSIWYLEEANSSKALWPTKNDFSAKWIGYIKAPVSGEITFYGEADNEMQLTIDGKTIVNTWGDINRPIGKMIVEKDRLYGITLLYRQINGSSYMRALWSWDGHEKEIIPATELSYDKNNDAEILEEFSSQVSVDLSQLEFDIASIIDIHSSADVLEKRKKVIELLWGKNGFPYEKQPDDIAKGIIDTNFVSLKNLKSINKLSITMEFGLNSIIYHFIPRKGNGSAAIYHQGHRGKFSLGKRTIKAFLEKGYDVFALSMPLIGMNNKPVVDFNRFGKMIIHSHNQMEYLQPNEGHPIKYFMEPVATVVNYAQNFDFEKLIMVGISGGGWTTTLYSAIDPRIKNSYPTAGTLPNFIRSREISNTHSLGDYEQQNPTLYRSANFMELYIMGSHGTGRSQLQILNEFDACCFRGTAYKEYKDIVKDRVKSLKSGSYDIFLDSSHRLHQISHKALEIIFNDLKIN
jgi:hypothetical protein